MSVYLDDPSATLSGGPDTAFGIGTGQYNLGCIIRRRDTNSAWSAVLSLCPDYAGNTPALGISFDASDNFVGEYGSGSSTSAGQAATIDTDFYAVLSRGSTGTNGSRLRIMPILVFMGVMTLLTVALVNKNAIAVIHSLSVEAQHVIRSIRGCG